MSYYCSPLSYILMCWFSFFTAWQVQCHVQDLRANTDFLGEIHHEYNQAVRVSLDETLHPPICSLQWLRSPMYTQVLWNGTNLEMEMPTSLFLSSKILTFRLSVDWLSVSAIQNKILSTCGVSMRFRRWKSKKIDKATTAIALNPRNYCQSVESIGPRFLNFRGS